MSDQIALAPPETNPTVASIDGMVDEVASLIGAATHPQIRAKALKALDRAADRMNMAGLFLFRRKEVQYDNAAAGGTGDLLLEDGDQTLILPDDWGWPERGALALDSSGDLLQELQWLPWETFRLYNAHSTEGASGVPAFISLKNEIEALVHIWSPVDTSDVASIVVPYYARILRPSEVNDSSLLASKETIEALITGGEAFIMRFRHKNQPGLWRPFFNDFDETVAKAKAASHRNQQTFDSWATLGEVGYDNSWSGANSRRFVVDLGS